MSEILDEAKEINSQVIDYFEEPRPLGETLADEEVADITGFKRPKEQKEWLIKNNWPFSVKGNGRPAIHRLVMRMKLGVPIENTQTDKEQDFMLDLSKVG